MLVNKDSDNPAVKPAKLETFLQKAQALGPVSAAIAHPTSKVTLEAAIECKKLGLIEPILVGPKEKIEQVAAEHSLDLSGLRIVSTEHSHESSLEAAKLVRTGDAEILIKGALGTKELLGGVLNRESGIRTDRRISHVFVIDDADYDKLLYVTDAAINIEPDLIDKKDIAQNCIDFAASLGVNIPKVAILAAVEKVNPAMQSTLDAAALCKMSDRKQIKNAVLDGPLAFDNAISIDAAKKKGIESEVAGNPDILLVPNIEAGNMLSKQLLYLGGATAAGIMLGARAPVVLTSRSELLAGRIYSCALARLSVEASK